MIDSSNKKNSIFIVGMLIGAAVFVCIYGTDILNFTNDSIFINGYIEKDVVQHYTGWMLYRNSPWQFPLGVGQNMAFPYGSAVSYTDSIPLFAMLFKLLRGFLPATFQYFGLFVLLCFMLQGGFGALLASLFNDNLFTDAVAAAVFVFSPVMIERAFRHCGLTAHFLILSALYYYFKNKGRTDFRAVIPFFVINAVAITIHPYFLPFTFGIMFAFSVENFLIHGRYVSAPAYVIASIVVTLAVGYAIGAFYVGGSMSSIGYGLYSMNLNAMFNPVSQGFDNWSAILEIKPSFTYETTAGALYGQIEGFNYLGLGVLAFIPVAGIAFLVSSGRKCFAKILEFIKYNFGIIFSTVALTVFAVGDWITYGGLKIFRLPIPDHIIFGIFGIFRANGRFGWLLGYIITGFVLYLLVKCTPKKLAPLLLAVLLTVQVYDMRGVIAEKKAYFTGENVYSESQSVGTLLKSTYWDKAAKEFDCVCRSYLPVDNKCIEIARKFAKQGKKVNTGFEARVNTEAFNNLTDQLYNRIIKGELEENIVVLFIELDDALTDAIKTHGYSIVFEDNIYAVFNKQKG
ncbi:MAG: hypothetical protein IJ362_04315 [Oscillospiraceae bacterium]|nr:hypothetical protein [Oscillospiraceae bacterium]